MDLLRRYHKPGGFLQLVQLIETCAPQKQQQLLSSVEKESPVWATEVRTKMLTIDRIFSWQEQPLAEIISRMQELTLSVAAHGIDKELWAKATKTLSHGQRRRIEDLSKTKSPTPGELLSAYTKIIAEVRDMINQGYVHLPSVDPLLIIEEDIEDRLGKRTAGVTHHHVVVTSSGLPPATMPVNTSTPRSATAATARAPSPTTAKDAVAPKDQESHLELAKLRLENQSLRLQVQSLQSELSSLRTVVAQIKKSVAS